MCPCLKVLGLFPFSIFFLSEQLKMGNIVNGFDQELQINEVKMKTHISVLPWILPHFIVLYKN